MKTAKLFFFLTLALATAGCAKAGDSQIRQWNMTVKVVDETGIAVSNAPVALIYGLPTASADSLRSARTTGLTDVNGVFAASHEDTGSSLLRLLIEKEGYYSVDVRYDLSGNYTPERWNLSPMWTLKKIIKPIPMYAKSINLGMPVFDKPTGFDFAVGDWVAPYGKGANADILFTAHLDKRGEYDSDYRLTVSFPSRGDGIQEFNIPATRFPPDGSALRSSQQAPQDGYQSEWIQTRRVRPEEGYSGNRDEKRNYYFRVRTVLDERGNVRSALYGKIYGDFMQFRYYLNPTPNDRNVEFDPRQNLLRGLKSFEQVTEP